MLPDIVGVPRPFSHPISVPNAGPVLGGRCRDSASTLDAAVFTSDVANPASTMLDIPQNRQILCAISFGYGDPDHPANSFRTSRADLPEFAEWRG